MQQDRELKKQKKNLFLQQIFKHLKCILLHLCMLKSNNDAKDDDNKKILTKKRNKNKKHSKPNCMNRKKTTKLSSYKMLKKKKKRNQLVCSLINLKKNYKQRREV